MPAPGTWLDLALGVQAQLQQQLASQGEAHSKLERELLEKVAQMQVLQQAHMDKSNQLQVCWGLLSWSALQQACCLGSMILCLWDDKLSQELLSVPCLGCHAGDCRPAKVHHCICL